MQLLISSNYLDIVSELRTEIALLAEVTGCRANVVADYHPGTPPKYIRTAGYYEPGDGGGGLYKLLDAEPEKPLGIFELTLSNETTAYYQLVPENGIVHTKQFGAKHDAVVNYTAGTVTGTDDTVAIQEAINYSIYTDYGVSARLFPGVSRITDTLHLGYGDTFRTAALKGEGQRYRAGSESVGCVIFADFSDRPAIAVQGARSSAIEGVNILGKLTAHIMSNKFTSFSELPLLDDTDEFAWEDHDNLAETQDARYAPYAAIAIDPFSGDKRTAQNITGITKANPAQVTISSHGRIAGEVLYIENVGGMVEITDGYYRVLESTGTNTFTLQELDGTPIDSTGYTTYTLGGTALSPSYPDATYPEWTGIESQYNKNFSSDVKIMDCYISGFAVAVANQPSDADGNADFTSLERLHIQNCKRGVSVCNAQSRNFQMNNIKAAGCHTFLTNRHHGKAVGKFGGVISDMSAARVMQLIDFGGVFPQPITFINTYAEALWRIGDIDFGSTNETGYIFDSCQFNFQVDATAAPYRGTPLTLLGGNATNGGFIKFRNGNFTSYGDIFTTTHTTIEFDGIRMEGGDANNRSNLYEKLAHNALAGGLVIANGNRPKKSIIKFPPYNLSTGSLSGITYTDKVTNSDRKYGVPYYCESAAHSLTTQKSYPPPVYSNSINKTSFSSLTLTDRTLEGTFTSRSNAIFLQRGPLPGDVLIDTDGFVFFVYYRSGTDIKANLRNGWKLDSLDSVELLEEFNATTGTFWVISGRAFLTTYYIRGDFTASNTMITNVGRDDDYSGFLNADVANTDSLLVDAQMDRFMSESITITSRDQTNSNIILSGTGGIRTQVRRPLGYFIMPGVENLVE